MKMIIGGAYQGQLAWAQAHFPEIADEDWIDGKESKETDIFTCKGICNFHEYIRNVKEEQYDKLADIIRENLDMKMVYEIIERGGK